MKANRFDIFDNKAIGNCSNNGISARYSTILVIAEDGDIEIDETKELPENLCKVVTRQTFGGNTETHVEPYNKPPKGHVGWMFSGSLVYGYETDEMFRLYDRCESYELYNSFD